MNDEMTLKKVMDLIDKIADSDDKNNIASLESELRSITKIVIYLQMTVRNIGDGQA